ncbi:hypothetical protein CR513_52639, partial [Mucuna pruriens]
YAFRCIGSWFPLELHLCICLLAPQFLNLADKPQVLDIFLTLVVEDSRVSSSIQSNEAIYGLMAAKEHPALGAGLAISAALLAMRGVAMRVAPDVPTHLTHKKWQGGLVAQSTSLPNLPTWQAIAKPTQTGWARTSNTPSEGRPTRPGLLFGSIFCFAAPRRFLFRNTLGRFQSEEARYARTEKNVKDLNFSVDLLKKESVKLLQRTALAEKEMKYGHTELVSAGTQFQQLAKSAYKVEAQAAGCFYGFNFEEAKIYAEQTDSEDQRVRGSCVNELMDKLWTFS